jgi:regulatory protein
MIVTAVERKRRRVDVFVDGELAIRIGAKLAAEQGVQPGVAITEAKLADLEELDLQRRAMETAVRLLAYRQRSVHEMRDRLRRKGIPEATITSTVNRLKNLGYLDDTSFARSWSESRRSASPRSARLLASELRLKGIAPEVANEATSGVSDEEAAYEAASYRLRSLTGLEYQKFRERLGRFLTSRGFSYDVSREVIERCWQEVGGADRASGDDVTAPDPD